MKASVGLVAAARDRELLGATPWYPRQLDLFDAIERHQTTIVAAGRRGGKSRVAAAAALWQLLLRPALDAFLPPFETRLALCIANSLEQAVILRDHASAIVRASPALSGELLAERETELEFRGGRTLRVLPCSARTARGLGAAIVILDELGHFEAEGEGPRAAGRVWAAVRPAVAAFGREGRIVATSTPGDEGGLFEQLYIRAESGELKGAIAFAASSLELNPGLDLDLRAEEVALGPAGFEREYLARFTPGGSGFFDRDELAAAVPNRKEALPEDGRAWVCALDPSEGGTDAFGCVVVGRDARPGYAGRLIVGNVERWLPRKGRASPSGRTRVERDLWVAPVFDRVASVAQRFRALVVSDQHAPAVVVDELRRRGVLSVRINPWTPSSKTEAYQALRARVATGRIELVNDDQLVTELRRVSNRFRAGSSAVHIPRIGDSHGDLGDALAAGVLELDRFGVTSWTPHRRAPAEPERMIANAATLDRLVSSERRDPTRTRRWHDPPEGIMGREF